LQASTNHQNPSHVAQARGSKMEDVTSILLPLAFGIMETLATKLVGSGRVNPFKPTEGEVVLPSSFKNHKGLLVKKMVSVSLHDLQLDVVQVEIKYHKVHIVIVSFFGNNIQDNHHDVWIQEINYNISFIKVRYRWMLEEGFIIWLLVTNRQFKHS
jgi:hypothetical protein